MLRSLIVLCLAAFATGCATDGLDRHAAKTPPAITPTEQFAITVSQAPDEILLAPHANGLSSAQTQALGALVDRWRAAGGTGPIAIRSPGGEGQAYRSVAAIQAALEAAGVSPDLITYAAYDASGRAGAPISVGFEGYKAQGPLCGRFKDYSQTFKNEVTANFGCATTANMAAMIANPADLLAPRATDAPDAQRRDAVLGKYVQGAVTSTAKDPQANGAVSSTVQ